MGEIRGKGGGEAEERIGEVKENEQLRVIVEMRGNEGGEVKRKGEVIKRRKKERERSSGRMSG